MSIALRSMTEGRLSRQILRFSLPLMLSNVLQVLFNMSDVAVVGHFAGSSALGSVGSTTTLVTLLTGILIGMGGGVNALTARFFGAQQQKDTSEMIHTSAIVCLALGLLLLGLGLGFAWPLLELLNTKETLIDGAALYLRIYVLGLPAMAIYNFGSGVLSAMGDTKRPLYFLFSAGVINVLLNLFFVIVCRLSVAGVALATVISQYISAVLIVLSLFRNPEGYALCFSELRLTKSKAIALLKLGIPAGLQNAIFAMANLFIQAGVNSFDAVMVEGNSAAANSDALIYDMMSAFYTACASFIGQNYGAGKRDRILKSYFISMAYAFGIGVIMGLGLVLLGQGFLSVFTKDAAVIEAGMVRLRIMGFSYGVSAFMDTAIAGSRGLGKSLVPTVMVILGSCVFRVAWVYTVFAHFHSIQSLYLVYVFSWSITAVAETVYFIHSYRKALPGVPGGRLTS